MPLRLRFLAFAASLLLALAVPCAASAAAARAATFVFSGGVAEPGGRPIRGAKVLLQGLAEPAALTDAEGRFSFTHVVPDVQALAAAPLRLVLRARYRGSSLALPTGESVLAVELRLVRAADASTQLEVRSNDAGVAKAVAASFGVPGDVTVALSAGFMRQLGAEDLSEPVLGALEIVQVAPPAPAATTQPPPAPAATTQPPPADSLPGEPAAKAGIVANGPPQTRGPEARPVVPDTATIARPGIRVSVRSDTAAFGPAATGSGGGSALRVALGRVRARALPDTQPPAPAGRVCECRVKGTVEASSDQLLRGSARVVVSIAGMPARCDTVALFMGAPRPFDLGLVPCGSHRLEVRPLSARSFKVAPPALDVFDCSAGRSQQVRVVLKPR
jgi:hypothetical protein